MRLNHTLKSNLQRLCAGYTELGYGRCSKNVCGMNFAE